MSPPRSSSRYFTISTVLICLFTLKIGHAVWHMSSLFLSRPTCTASGRGSGLCVRSAMHESGVQADLALHVFTTSVPSKGGKVGGGTAVHYAGQLTVNYHNGTDVEDATTVAMKWLKHMMPWSIDTKSLAGLSSAKLNITSEHWAQYPGGAAKLAKRVASGKASIFLVVVASPIPAPSAASSRAASSSVVSELRSSPLTFERALQKLGGPNFVLSWTIASEPVLKMHVAPDPTFNLLSSQPNGSASTEDSGAKKATLHLQSKMVVNVVLDRFEFDYQGGKNEVDVAMASRVVPLAAYAEHLGAKLPRQDGGHVYLPICYVNGLHGRSDTLRPWTEQGVEIEVQYGGDISLGHWRLYNAISGVISSSTLFSDSDMDDVKSLMVDTSIVLLLVTLVVSALHLLLDFLSIKNDVSFWRSKNDMAGTSLTQVRWSAFSSAVVLLFLWDAKSSRLVVLPALCTFLIDCWKCFKATRIVQQSSAAEADAPESVASGDSDRLRLESRLTRQFDLECMTYLTRYAVGPLCIAGAAYSLAYVEHASWTSWLIQSTVHFVYSFGFVFMIPQLYVNYKLKSVAHLNWRALLYRAFNTFIDDLFAFIIEMPTSHRVACFRDDLVFFVYLYQRYLYPVQLPPQVGEASSRKKVD